MQWLSQIVRCRDMGKQLKDGRALMTVSAKTAAILNGDEDLSAWDDEELLRGQRKDRGGYFRGRPPKVVPQEVHAERVRRTMSKAFDLLKESSYDAVHLFWPRSLITIAE